MSKLLVENTENRIHNLGGHCVLMPGHNEVDETAWKKALEIELVRDLVRMGVLKPKVTPPAATGAQTTIAAMKATEAIEVVKKTVDKDLLERWYAEDQRKGVLDAIEKQLEAVNPKTATPPAATGAQE